jgi:predicted O-methyltransferase YrrM
VVLDGGGGVDAVSVAMTALLIGYWIVLGNGIPWYGLAVFLGVSLVQAVLVVHAGSGSPGGRQRLWARCRVSPAALSSPAMMGRGRGLDADGHSIGAPFMSVIDLTDLPASDPTRLYRYRDGLYAADLMAAAIVHLDLFTWLADHPADLEGICRKFGICERPADVLMTLAAANGLVERRGDVFQVTLVAREHLTAGSRFNLAAYYASLKDRPVVRDFQRVLSTGRPAHWGAEEEGLDWHAAMETEDFARSFTAAMDGRGHYLGGVLARVLDLSPRARVLDIGGGSGIYACSLVARHPHLQATVLEQRPVDAIARRLIGERGLADRVSVATGEMFQDPWPAGHDVHLFSNVLHDWGATDVRRLLARSAASIRPGGLVVIHEAFVNADKTGPLPVAEYSALLMHSTQGKCYAVSEYEAFLSEAGFEAITHRDTAADRGVMTALAPR